MLLAEPIDRTELLGRPLPELRKAIRAGRFSEQTGGLAPGKLQGNLAILPAALAQDFSTFCQRNPKPCPLVGVSDIGDPFLRSLGADIDIRIDVPRYNVYRDGALAEQVTDIRRLWRDDLVAFVLGCSYSFDLALLNAGIPLRHLELGKTPPVYVTNVPTVPAGPFNGPLVVSMRPLTVPHAIKAIEITSRFPHTHGAPVHFGDPDAIGVEIDAPDWGGPAGLRDGEVPVFWACGVTPQAVLRQARPPLCITHAPGCMLITDLDA
jgi:uncharacterized protein YcsI (UPF0317 family)